MTEANCNNPDCRGCSYHDPSLPMPLNVSRFDDVVKVLVQNVVVECKDKDGNFVPDPNLKDALKNLDLGSLGAFGDDMAKDLLNHLQHKHKQTSKKLPIYKTIRLLTEETFHHCPDLLLSLGGQISSPKYPFSVLVQIKVGTAFDRVQKIVADLVETEISHIRIWIFLPASGRGRLLRPSLLTQDILASPKFTSTVGQEHFFFVEKYLTPLPSYSFSESLLLFVKILNGINLDYFGCLYVNRLMTIGNFLKEFFGEKGLNIPMEDSVRVFHEIGDYEKDELLREIKDFSTTVEDALVINESGSEVLVIGGFKSEFLQLYKGTEAIKAIPHSALNVEWLVQILGYYTKTVRFTDADTYKYFKLDISLKSTCNAVARILAHHLKTEPDQILLFECLKFGCQPIRTICHLGREKDKLIETVLPSDEENANGATYNIGYQVFSDPVTSDDPRFVKSSDSLRRQVIKVMNTKLATMKYEPLKFE